MTETNERGLKLAYFILGIAVPIGAYVLWTKTEGFGLMKRSNVDKAHDITVEDSFPASDPPSAW
jgi:hypothetical protein